MPENKKRKSDKMAIEKDDKIDHGKSILKEVEALLAEERKKRDEFTKSLDV